MLFTATWLIGGNDTSIVITCSDMHLCTLLHNLVSAVLL